MLNGAEEFTKELASPAYRSRTTGTTSGILHAEEAETEQVPHAGERRAETSPETVSHHFAAASESHEGSQEWEETQKAGDEGAGNGRTSGFGLNNLISRMTGLAPSSQSGRREPAVASNSRRRDEYGGERVSEFEQNEIPAFLRRQAN